MAKNKNRIKRTWKDRFLRHYRYSIVDEGSLEERFHLRITRLGFIALTTLITILFVALVVAICFYTPFKRLGPNYADIDIRKSLIQESLRVDSLQHLNEMQSLQIDAIKAIFNGEIKIDANTSETEFKAQAKDFIPKSKEEQQFCDNYEAKERYNLSSIEDVKMEEVPLFFRPVRGVVKRAYDSKERHWGCDVLATANEPVLASLEGKIIVEELTTSNEWVVAITHENGYMTIYKNLAQVLKRVGENIKTGEAIGIVSLPNDGGKPYIHFELWKNNESINPADYISF